MSKLKPFEFQKDKWEKKTGHKEDYWRGLVSNKLNIARDYRSNYYDKQWFINWAYYWGITNLQYNKKTKQLSWTNKDPLKFNVNEIYTIVRAIRNTVTKYQPRWVVDKIPGEDVEPRTEQLVEAFLEHEWKDLKMKFKIKEVVLHGLNTQVGIVQYGYDAEKDDLFVDVLDPFDVYIDPNCGGDITKANYVIKVLTQDIEDLKHKYPDVEITSSGKTSESEWKEMLDSKRSTNTVEGTALIYEAWIWVWEDNKKKLKVITMVADNGQVLRVEDAGYDRVPFVVYKADINPGEIYGEGWTKNLVPLQRALNINERNTLEYHTTFAKGKYVTTNTSGIKVITNENGKIIKKARGELFEQLDMKPMTSSVFQQNANLLRYMQDIGAANEAFMGRAPGSLQSGAALETLIANNMVQLTDLVDNLEIFLAELGEELLKLAHKYYKKPHSFQIEKEGAKETIKAYGKFGSKVGIEPGDNRLLLPKSANLRVVIDAGLAYTKQGRQETLFKLRAQGDIDRRTLLEELGSLDVNKIEARLAEERAGQPISETGNIQAQPAEEQGQEQPQRQGLPANPDELAQFLEENNLQLSDDFQDPQLLQQLLNGEMDFDIVDGVITPKNVT